MDLHSREALPRPVRMHRMLPVGNTARCPAALLAVLLTVASAVAQGQPSTTQVATDLAATPHDAPLVDWGIAQRAFYEAERWARAGGVDMGQGPLWVRNVAGARVTFRWLGRTMAIGDSTVADDPAQDRGVVDLLAVVRVATDAALTDARANIKAHNVRARQQADGAARPWMLQDLQPLAVDLQVALPAEPVVVAGPAPDAVLDSFAPGYHGLLLARHDDPRGRQARTWPATALAGNFSPASQLIQPLADLGYPPATVQTLIGRLGRKGGPILARFEVIHLVRPQEDVPVEHLVRGNLLLPAVSVTDLTLRTMAQRLAEHLRARQQEDGGFLGTYHPTRDHFDPAQATLVDSALGAYALARYERLLVARAPRAVPAELVESRERCLRFLIKRVLAPDASDAAAQAMTLLVSTTAPDSQQRKVERDGLVAKLMAEQAADGSFPASGASPQRGAAVQALVTAALAAAYEQSREPALLQSLTMGRQALNLALGDELDVAALPWLTLLDNAGQRAVTTNAADPPTATQPAWAWEGWADRLWSRQVRGQPSLGPGNVIGGFQLGELDAAAPTPDWHSAQVLVFLAHEMVRRPHAQQQQRMLQALNCGLAARFLDQLTFNEASCWYVRSRRDVLGGLRSALWDNRLSTGPTAMGLLAVVELQEALASLEPAPTSGAASSQPARSQ